jgi:serine/threonine-protein kinase
VRADEDKRRSGAAYVLIGIAVSLAIALIGFGLKFLIDSQNAPAQIVVPSVKGKPQATAEFEVRKAGLSPKVETEPSEDIAKGTVIRQDPEGGERVASGAVVTLVVSSGKDAVAVPPCEGKTEVQFAQELGDLQLSVGTRTEEDSPDQDKGAIVSCSPAAGESVAPGGKVDIVVASGKVTVPNVTDFTRTDAVEALAKVKLEPKITYQETSNSSQVGKVISQKPNTGTLDQGATVELVIGIEATPTPPPTTPPPSSAPPPDPSPSVTPTP